MILGIVSVAKQFGISMGCFVPRNDGNDTAYVYVFLFFIAGRTKYCTFVENVLDKR